MNLFTTLQCHKRLVKEFCIQNLHPSLPCLQPTSEGVHGHGVLLPAGLSPRGPGPHLPAREQQRGPPGARRRRAAVPQPGVGVAHVAAHQPAAARAAGDNHITLW